MKVLRAVSFDIWGTLLNLDKFFEGVAEELAGLTGRDKVKIEEQLYSAYLKAKEMRREGKFSEGRIVLEALSVVSEATSVEVETIKRAICRCILNVRGEDAKIDGVDEVLEFCSSKGLKIVTLGNVLFWPGWYTRILIEKAGIASRLISQIYADEIGHSKPKKEAFKAAMMAAGVSDPQEMIHVGDSELEDGEGALSSGMRAIIIKEGVEGIGKERRGELEIYYVDSIKRVPEVISSLL